MARRRFRLRIFLCVLAFVVLLFFTRTLWLSALGYALVYDEGPAKAGMAVVLAGDSYGHRILRAGELVRAGYVPLVLVSGPPGNYGYHECDLAIPFAVRRGFPAEWFAGLAHEGLSTRTEGLAILQELRRRNVKSFLLVTSDYHSARARRIYLADERAMGGGPAFRMVTCPDEFFRANSWWRTREGQKTAFMEWSKTVATVFGF